MAKKKTMQEILNQSWKDVQQLSTKELKTQINTLNAVANKRIKRVKELDIESPATRDLEEFFKLEQSNNKQGLQKQFSRLTDFLSMPTTTIKGAREYTQLSNELAKLMGYEETKQGRTDAWDLLEKYRAKYPNVISTGSDPKYHQIAKIVGKYGVTDLDDIEKIRQFEDTFKDDFEYFEEDEGNDEVIQFFMGR